jgi:hypothetical protein
MPSGIEFRVHPLVLLNLSDHYTRCARAFVLLFVAGARVEPLARRSFKAQQALGEPPRVLGCLLGSHSARTVDIANSFEIKYDGVVNNVPQIDCAFLAKKQEQCARARDAACDLGFWTLTCGSHRGSRQEGLPQVRRRRLVLHRRRAAGRRPGAAAHGACADRAARRFCAAESRVVRPQTMTAITESPVFVLFNPAARNVASKDLPITLYESGAWLGAETAPPFRLSHAPPLAELHVVGDAPVLTFVKSAYTIEVRRACAFAARGVAHALRMRSRARRSASQSTT